jgi:hypothetical protein
MPFFYKVCGRDAPFEAYPCGEHPDDESAVMHFNSVYGSKMRRSFTTEGTREPRADYELVVQQRASTGAGLSDLRTVRLFDKP